MDKSIDNPFSFGIRYERFGLAQHYFQFRFTIQKQARWEQQKLGTGLTYVLSMSSTGIINVGHFEGRYSFTFLLCRLQFLLCHSCELCKLTNLYFHYSLPGFVINRCHVVINTLSQRSLDIRNIVSKRGRNIIFINRLNLKILGKYMSLTERNQK